MDFSPELLAAAAREFALLHAEQNPVESYENGFDQEFLQNAVNEFERIPPEEFQNLLEAIPPARPPRPKRERKKRAQRQRDREEFECANFAMYNRREIQGIEIGTGWHFFRWRWAQGLEEDLTPKFVQKI